MSMTPNSAGCFCDGNGDINCPGCLGDGEVRVIDSDDPHDARRMSCAECQGRGYIKCPAHED